MRRDKLYTVNKWNRKLFEDGGDTVVSRPYANNALALS